MKTILKYRLSILTCFALIGIVFTASAQEKQFKARISAQYVKVMNKESFISLSAKYKRENGFEPASGVEFNVYKMITDDSLISVGKTKTNDKGVARFTLNPNDIKNGVTSTVFNYTAKIENNSKFDDNETIVSFSDANLKVEVQSIDSVRQIKATLTDAAGNPLTGQPLNIGLLRMFAPLQIGEESYETDEEGSILVPIEEPMAGINGNLTFEVALNESDQYGTVKALVTVPIGIPIKDESTFDQRTMWSPPSKTPYYLRIFPNLIILGVWIPILILVFNLYQISKAKPDTL